MNTAVDKAHDKHVRKLKRQTRPIRKRFPSQREASRQLYRRIKLGPPA